MMPSGPGYYWATVTFPANVDNPVRTERIIVEVRRVYVGTTELYAVKMADKICYEIGCFTDWKGPIEEK